VRFGGWMLCDGLEDLSGGLYQMEGDGSALPRYALEDCR